MGYYELLLELSPSLLRIEVTMTTKKKLLITGALLLLSAGGAGYGVYVSSSGIVTVQRALSSGRVSKRPFRPTAK
jgi:hypothetical protein